MVGLQGKSRFLQLPIFGNSGYVTDRTEITVAVIQRIVLKLPDIHRTVLKLPVIQRIVLKFGYSTDRTEITNRTEITRDRTEITSHATNRTEISGYSTDRTEDRRLAQQSLHEVL